MMQERLEKEFPDLLIRTFDVIDSTNTEAKRMVLAGERRTALLVADEQTAGRGRMGRDFYSPKKTGIYMTLLYCPKDGFDDMVRATAKTSAAVLKGIEAVLPVKLTIKWVNDLYLKDRKVCGILAETVSDGKNPPALVIGIGINVTTEVFPEEIQKRAGALTDGKDENPDALREDIITETVKALLFEVENLHDRSYLDIYRSRSNVLGRTIRYGTEPCFKIGKAVEIDEDGALIAENPDGTRERLFTGEISVRIEDGSLR